MNATVVALTRSGVSLLSRVQDFVELTKPRISVLVSMTAATAICVAMSEPDAALIFHVSLATAMVAASASAFNQIIERNSDRKMERTASRAIPSGRVSVLEATTFGLLLLGGGSLYLWLTANWLTATIGLLTWVLYVGMYTPLKRITTWNTFIGAFPGAMPILMGWAATGQSFDARAWSLFALLFCWQFPHFMAIAWRCREQYADADLKMITVADPTGGSAGVYSVISGIAVIVVSGVMAYSLGLAPVALVALACLGFWQLAWSVRFWAQTNDETALGLLRASLVYLPLVLIGVVLTSFI
jgi:protoheme IX farnesyltransferase